MRIRNETGRTLIEMMGVLAVMGVMIVGAMTGLRFGVMWMQASSAYTAIENTAAGVIDIYSYEHSYPLPAKTKAMADKIVKGGDICTDCVATVLGAEAKSPWGSKMIIQPGDETYFKIVAQNVPQAACIRLAEMQWNYMEWFSPVVKEGGKDKPDCSGEYAEIEFHSHSK